MMFSTHSTKKSHRRNSSLASMSDEDNEEEGDERRRNEVASLSTSALSVAGPSGLNNNNKKAPNGNLEAYFQLYIKNKITSHNAWQLDIFECITSLLESNTNLSSLLQKICTSLDIGAKVYSVRVDDVHFQTLQLANSLALAYKKHELLKRKNENEDESSDEDSVPSEKPTANEPPRKKRKRICFSASEERRTIVTNENLINGPVQKQTRELTLVQNNSYLNLVLPITPNNFELLVNNSLKRIKWDEVDSNSCSRVLMPVLEELELSSSTICPAFHEFDVDQWDPDEYIDLFNKSNLSEAEFMSLMKSPKMRTQTPKSTASSQGEDDCAKSVISGITLLNDDDGKCVPQYDYDLTDDNGPEDMEVVETIAHGQEANLQFITDMRPESAQDGNLEYSYRKIPKDKIFESFWAGPSHWKLKHLKRTSTPTSEIATTGNKGKSKLTDVMMPLSFDGESEASLIEALKPSTKPMYRSHISRNETEGSVLPEQINFEVNKLISTFHGKTIRKSEITKNVVVNSKIIDVGNINDDDDDEDRNDEGWGGATPHPVTDDEDSALRLYSEHDNQFGPDEGVQVSMIGAGTENENNWILTASGNVVKKGWVPFYNQAKRIDMKQLKSTMWKEISEKCDNSVPETTLLNIYGQLPKKLSHQQAENLSVPLAFVTLLHLANEHSLSLESNSTLSDIIVKKDGD